MNYKFSQFSLSSLVITSLKIEVLILTAIGAIFLPNYITNAQTAEIMAQQNGETGKAITTTSGESEKQLAKHLKKMGAKYYGVWWCPHCYAQKQLFGKEAWRSINAIECDPRGVNPKTQLCRAAKIEGFPTWEIKGKLYVGTQSLERLANITEYKGPRNFRN